MLSDEELDHILSRTQSGYGWEVVIAQAREANALRAENARLTAHAQSILDNANMDYERVTKRCADLELMLRAKIQGGYRLRRKSELMTVPHPGWVLAGESGRDGYKNERGKALGWSYFIDLEDDGTGLPLLTDEARAALKAWTKP